MSQEGTRVKSVFLCNTLKTNAFVVRQSGVELYTIVFYVVNPLSKLYTVEEVWLKKTGTCLLKAPNILLYYFVSTKSLLSTTLVNCVTVREL